MKNIQKCILNQYYKYYEIAVLHRILLLSSYSYLYPPLNLYLIIFNKTTHQNDLHFSAQFGGINPSLYLNPEDETKEVCAKCEYYDELGYFYILVVILENIRVLNISIPLYFRLFPRTIWVASITMPTTMMALNPSMYTYIESEICPK